MGFACFRVCGVGGRPFFTTWCLVSNSAKYLGLVVFFDPAGKGPTMSNGLSDRVERHDLIGAWSARLCWVKEVVARGVVVVALFGGGSG